MKRYAVIGRPVAHSKSPLMFNSFFKRNKIDAYYSRIASNNLEDTLETCNLLGVKGINITMPYKKDLLKITDSASEEAMKVEGVNTLVFDGKTKGFNTDIFGALIPLKKALRNLKNKKILVIGAGGAARAALFAYKREGAECFVSNRSEERGRQTASRFGAEFISFEEIDGVLNSVDAVVYTIPVKIDINISLMKRGAVFFTAIYKQHFFKEECENNRVIYISGEEWLIGQGKVSCSKFGFNCNDSDLFIREIKGRKLEKIALIGFMGSGKTTIGNILGEKIGYDFIDLDKEIEKGEGKNIPDIFKRYGEGYFRRLEKEYLLKFSREKKILLATGGGILTNKDCFQELNNSYYNIFLCGDIKEFYKRTARSDRPLRLDFNSFHSLYKKRIKDYYGVSDLILNTSNKDLNTSVETIYYELGKLLNS